MSDLDPYLVQAIADAIDRTEARMDAARYRVPRGKREPYFDVYKPQRLRAQAEAAINAYLRKRPLLG